MASKRRLSAEQMETAEAEILERSKRIEFYMTEYSVEFLAEKMRDGEFVVPGYQRAFTWEPPRKARFIESVIMGLPIPFLFFWERPDGKLEIVDGSQRLRTLEEYILGDLKLQKLKELPSLTNTRFVDLSESRQRKIKNRSIRGIILNELADEEARFDMFERINTSSKQANTAEVRRGALGGAFLNLVIELAQDEQFKKMAPVSEKAEKEREREELVTRFFAYGSGLKGYRDKPAQFIFDFAKQANADLAANQNLVEEYRHRFKEMLEFVERYFPFGFRKTRTSGTTQRARFESISIGVSHALSIKPKLMIDGPPSIDAWIVGKEFDDVTGSDGANVQSRLVRRLEFVRDKLLAEAA